MKMTPVLTMMLAVLLFSASVDAKSDKSSVNVKGNHAQEMTLQGQGEAYGQAKESIDLNTQTPSGWTLESLIETSLIRAYPEHTLSFEATGTDRLNVVFTNLTEVVSSVQILSWTKAKKAENSIAFEAPFLTIVEDDVEVKCLYTNFDVEGLQASLESEGGAISAPDPVSGVFAVLVDGEVNAVDFAATTEPLIEKKEVRSVRYAVGKVTDRPLPYLAGGVATEVRNLSKRSANYATLISNVTRWMAPYQPGHPTYQYLLGQKSLYEAEKAKCDNRIAEIFDGLTYYRYKNQEVVVPFFDDAADQERLQAGEIVMGNHEGQLVVAQGKKFQKVNKVELTDEAGSPVDGCKYFKNTNVWEHNPNVSEDGYMCK